MSKGYGLTQRERQALKRQAEAQAEQKEAEFEALKKENKRLKGGMEDIREMSEFPGFAIIEDRKAVGSLLDIIHETAKQALLKEE